MLEITGPKSTRTKGYLQGKLQTLNKVDPRKGYDMLQLTEMEE